MAMVINLFGAMREIKLCHSNFPVSKTITSLDRHQGFLDSHVDIVLVEFVDLFVICNFELTICDVTM